jgi:hypothetical protein
MPNRNDSAGSASGFVPPRRDWEASECAMQCRTPTGSPLSSYATSAYPPREMECPYCQGRLTQHCEAVVKTTIFRTDTK